MAERLDVRQRDRYHPLEMSPYAHQAEDHWETVIEGQIQAGLTAHPSRV